MGRAPCCDKANVKRGPWSPEEDEKLKEYIHRHGTASNWIALPHKAGLKRCGKSCRLRWLNYLRPNLKHGDFSEEEDGIICSLFSNIGSRWSVIAAHLPGRTDNDIKNYWNTKLKKKLMAMSSPPLLPPRPPPLRQAAAFSSSFFSNSPSASLPHSTSSLSQYPSISLQTGRHETTGLVNLTHNKIKEENYHQDGFLLGGAHIPTGIDETQFLDYGLEEIKQLISTGCGNNNTNMLLFDENKTDVMYY